MNSIGQRKGGKVIIQCIVRASVGEDNLKGSKSNVTITVEFRLKSTFLQGNFNINFHAEQ